MEELKNSHEKLEHFTDLFISISKFFEDWNNFQFSDLKIKLKIIYFLPKQKKISS